ncbi:MAG: hypothetical protein PUC65_09590 [Clostridiales bacterium]|nr:hypothetical protein [Clostridiales bacterium]
MKGNFDGLIFQLRHMFGEDTPAICMAETGLFSNPEAKQLTEVYLTFVEAAGKEYKVNGKISDETQYKLDDLLVPRDEYIENINQVFGMLKKQPCF